MLTAKHIDYLRGVMRKEVRWRTALVENFQVRPEQTEEEAEEKQVQLERLLGYAQSVLAELDKLSERARTVERPRSED